jgi:hypothetical protein
MANLYVTVTNKTTGQQDSKIASPYIPALKKEQENTLVKDIINRNHWKESECVHVATIMPC